MSDYELIQKIKRGGNTQQLAIKELYAKNHAFIFKKLKENRSLSEDAVKDAYADSIITLRDHIVSGRFEQRSKLSSYLYSIFSNKCIDIMRKNTTYKGKIEREMAYELPEHLKNRDPQIVELLIVKETFGTLKSLIEKLGESCQQVLMDWGFWGFSMKEIAMNRGFKDEHTVRSKKYNCLKQLRASILSTGIEQELGI